MNIQRRIYLLLLTLTVFFSTALAQKDWVDVTSEYITNPDFATNQQTGWTVTNLGAMKIRANTMEFWNATSNIYQTIYILPAGHYRASVQGFYRCRDNNTGYQNYTNGTENITGRFYAGDNEVKLVSVYSKSYTENLENQCWSTFDRSTYSYFYFPNGMESASAAFAKGDYWNTIEFDHPGGELTIGIRCDEMLSNNWCIFSNFKLEEYTTIVLATGLIMTPLDLNLVLGEEAQLHATITPENVTFKTLSWTSTNTNVATVDANGKVKAVGLGSAVIIAKTTDGSNKQTKSYVTVTSNPATSSSLIINEIMASNVDQFMSPAYNFDGFIELYNPTDKAVEIGSLYYGQSRSNLKEWHSPKDMGVIPSKGYRLIWFDSNNICQQNATFKLDVDGGTIFISNENGDILAQQSWPASMERVSYARKTDGTGEWGMTDTPTPGGSNNNAKFATVQIGAPVVNTPSQLFSGQLIVSADIPAGTTLRYTTDGTLPTLTNGYTSSSGQFSINTTRTLRLRLFADDMLASPVTSRAYIERTQDYTLPIVAVSIDPDFLYDDSIGVMVRGVNGRPGNGQSTPCNWNMDWERPGNFAYMLPSGETVFTQDADLEMSGGWTRASEPHSFKLKGNKELGGVKQLSYPFFSFKPYIRNRTLQIRNGGNESNNRFKDPAIQTIILSSGIDIDGQSYQPVHEFINGKYIGVLNVREPNNKHYVYANYGWEDDEIDQFEISPDSFYVQKCGTDEAFQELLSLSASANNQESFEQICQLLDIDEYINYMAAMFYLGNSDWTRNNVKGFRLRDGGRFRFVVFDTDGAFSYSSNVFEKFFSMEYNYTFDLLYPSLTKITTDNTLVRLFRQLMQNRELREKFVSTYSVVAGGVYRPERVNYVVDSLFNNVAPAMSLEGRYNDLSNMANSLKSTFANRNQTMMNALKSYSLFQHSGVQFRYATLSSDAPTARIEVNGIDVPTGQLEGYLFQGSTVKAVAPTGYVFRGWRAKQGTTVLFDNGALWNYYDKGSLDGKSWHLSSYSTSGWSQGNAPLGYGQSSVVTTISYGNNSQNKYSTYYFRRNVNLTDAPSATDNFYLDYVADDGFVVYVNGTEAARYNMPNGTPSYSTYATTYAHDNPDRGTVTLPASLFKKGNNLIAVELHNNSASSSDILWDAALRADIADTSDNFYSTDAEIQLPANDINLVASYRELTASERAEQGLCAVRINEVSGSNSALVNQYNKKNDWVELYNTTNESVDIEGMYLSDDLDEPDKYRISKDGTNVNTVIPPHGHIIVWCDKLKTTDRELHASFKIDGDGGFVLLTSANSEWADTLVYDAHDGNTTVGRYPDGASDVFTMTTPTIEKANIITSYSEQTEQVVTAIGTATVRRSGQLSIAYGHDQLIVRTEEPTTAQISIFTPAGTAVDVRAVSLHNGANYIDVSSLKQGIYIARATDTQGNRVACRFAK